MSVFKRMLGVFVVILVCLSIACSKSLEDEDTNNREDTVFVKGGCYQMGCGSWTNGCVYDEKPEHEVCLDDFYIDKYEVTQKEFKKIMGENPSKFKGDVLPVERVTWDEAKKFCAMVGKRLPTEAEWEYAARSGGKREKYAGTSSESELGKYAWDSTNSKRKTHPVGQKTPNGLGIYDMIGNVNELVEDWYDVDYYKKSPKNNPKGPDFSYTRVSRGGSFHYRTKAIRSSKRTWTYPDGRIDDRGFRCSRTP